MSTRKKGTTAKKATATKTTAKKSTARTRSTTTGRAVSVTTAKKAAPAPTTRPRATRIVPGKQAPGDSKIIATSPYEVRVGGTAVPIVPFRTEALIQHVGSVTAAAELLGVDKSQPTRWRKGTAIPSPEKGRLLNDLEHVFSRAAMIFEPEVIKDWMTGPNRYLGGRPIDVLRERGASEVLDALDVAEQMAFGG